MWAGQYFSAVLDLLKELMHPTSTFFRVTVFSADILRLHLVGRIWERYKILNAGKVKWKWQWKWKWHWRKNRR
jgi:hypothetical protein